MLIPAYPTPLLNSPPGQQQNSRTVNAAQLLNELTQQTRHQPNGMVVFPEALIGQACQLGEPMLAVIQASWGNAAQAAKQGQLLPALARMYTAERIAEAGANIDKLYPLFSQLDRNPHPLIAIYLAGVYAKMHRPEPFGWVVMKLMETAQQPPNPNQPHTWKLHEELGKLLSQQLQLKPALWQQLQPYLKGSFVN